MTSNEFPFDISLTDVSKTYPLGLWKKKEAVRGVSFAVPRGEVVGLLGPNGSGKSTILKMSLGFIRPTAGEILVCGHPPSERQSRAFVGYLPENPRFQKFLSAKEVLFYYGTLCRLEKSELSKRVDELLDLVGLSDARAERIAGFSKGMVQRLAMAQALLSRPRILLFDEPMSGLDPLGRLELRRLIGRIHEEMPEATIFFSSHVLSDVEQLCASVILLSKGELKNFCRIDELLGGRSEAYEVTARGLPAEHSTTWGKRIRRSPLGETWSIEGTDELLAALNDLKTMGAQVVGVFSQRASLEQKLFGKTSVQEARTPEGVLL
ncbi:MAG: ABC transporter ATP-binding protein [Bdellovibrionales bacterium]|nr:ABC transporter ATP-binding protein [Bdellovibrionales bacterium]